MGKLIDLVGKRFGRLLVVSVDRTRRVGNNLPWNCICDCGAETSVSGQELRLGKTKSCGCYRKEATAEHNRTDAQRAASAAHNTIHGEYDSPTYKSWRGMIERCANPNHISYKYYGAIGVKVCDRWREYAAFRVDMSERPENMTIDRFPDPYGNYEPGNCRWATFIEQNLNKRQAAA